MGGNERRNRKLTLSQIRNRVQVLQRKFALELTVIRLRPYATEFCQQWAVAKANQQPALQASPLYHQARRCAGFRFPNFIDLHDYIKRKEDPRPRTPNHKGIVYIPHSPCQAGRTCHRRRLPLGPHPASVITNATANTPRPINALQSPCNETKARPPLAHWPLV